MLLNLPYQALYGINYRNATPEILDLREMPAIEIVGKTGMGKHNIVRVSLDSLEDKYEIAPVDIYILDDYGKRYVTYSNHRCVKKHTRDVPNVKIYNF